MHISEEYVRVLDSQPLSVLMERAGHHVDHKAGNEYYYSCPFHADHAPSLCVTVEPKNPDGCGDFFCHGCHAGGHGAIELQSRLLHLDRNSPKDFLRICTSIARIFNLKDPANPDRNANDNWRRAKKADEPSPEIRYTYKPWDDFDLRALGCKVRQAFAPATATTPDASPSGSPAILNPDGSPVKVYSWGGAGYYRPAFRSPNFDPQCITHLFGIRPVESFVTEQRVDRKTGELVSWKVSSSPDYPIFDMRYATSDGWRSKKYEPNALPDKDGHAFKFTWWFSDGRHPDSDSTSLTQALYGDIEFMEAFASGIVKPATVPEGSPSGSSSLTPHPSPLTPSPKPTIQVIVNPESPRPKYALKFRRLIICSGPRDGLNVYFHSDAHVCWSHSEAVGLSESTISRLLSIAHEVYVLFDSDRTGIQAAEDIALQSIGVRVVYLPSDLGTIVSSRTGKPCKDAAEYFSEYPILLRKNRTFRRKTINDHFESLLVKAHSMKFWDEQYTMRKTENGVDRYVKTKYTLNPTNMAQFLGASGMYRYTDTASMRQYVFVDSDGVRVLPKADINLTAKQLMKNYLCEHPRYNKEDLMNMISTSARLSADTIEEIPGIDLDFRAYGPDLDYFYLRNCALKITSDTITPQSYSQIPYAVNVDAKRPWAWNPAGDEFFRISVNPEYEARVREHETWLKACKSDQQVIDENVRFADWERTWRFVLEYVRPFSEWPPVLQYVYNTGRIFWRMEELDKLTPAQRQFQDAQFISKVFAFGYFLHRYRTDAMQRMVMATDYAVLRNEKPNGRNGKSAMLQLLSFVRNILYVDGKLFKKKAETASLNFYDYKLTVHDAIFIDDLHRSTDEEIVYNMILRMEYRTLYENPTKLSPEDSPKIMVTCNKSFDVNTPSTYGRLVPIYFCDYYHAENVTGGMRTRSMATEFHRDIFKPRSQREVQHILEFLAQCLQYHLRLANNKFAGMENSFDVFPVVAPVDRVARTNMSLGSFNFVHFVEWAHEFFSTTDNAHHFARPVAVEEMILSLIRYEGNMELSVQRVRQHRRKFLEDIVTYAGIYNIVINPEVVSSSETDRSRRVTRRTTWVTPTDESGRYLLDAQTFPRTKSSVDCMYFYTMGSNSPYPTPLAPKDVLKCTDMDLGDSI